MDAYTIYFSPDDKPGAFVVRRFLLANGASTPTADVRVCGSLEEAREAVPGGLICFARSPEDQPSVVETWL